MAEITSKNSPESQIIISTLLPRHNTPPQIIYSINAAISRGCSALPNVHLAHHHHIGFQHLYDGLHLHKDGVRIFANTLKDAALGRSPASLRHLLPTPQYHRPIHPYMPRHPPPAPVRTEYVNCTDSEEEGLVNPSPSPSSPSERQLRESLALHRLDKHHTLSTTPTNGSLHTCKPAVTNFTSTCTKRSLHS